jgi:hypothetical protein
MFTVSGGAFVRGDVYAFDKTNLYTGPASASFTLFNPQDAQGKNDIFTMAPAVTYDNSVGTEFLFQTFNGNPGNGTGLLRLSSVTGAVGSELLNVGIGPGGQGLTIVNQSWDQCGLPGCADFAPQSGTPTKIDAGDDRMLKLVFRNNKLWASQTVFLPAGGPNRAAVQWMQLDTTFNGGTNGNVLQFGRIDDSSGTFYRAYPTIAVNSSEDALLGYSVFSSGIFASARYAFRSHIDALNTFQAEGVLKDGLGPYDKTFGQGSNRWGDYSNTVVDPVNDTDMWTIQEYAEVPTGSGADSGNWGTWWGKIAVAPVLASQLQVTAPAAANVGIPFSITVTAQDSGNNTVGGYRGTVHFTSSDAGATLPADYTFTAGDNGVHTFNNGVSLLALGSVTITATDTVNGSITGSASVTVSPGPATHFSVTAPASSTAGSFFTANVQALDAGNHNTTNYMGTVHFTSSDAQAVLPTNSTLTNGFKSFSVTLKTAGSQTVKATDTVTFSITGNTSVTVNAAAANHYSLTVPPSATVNTPFTIRLVAQDAFNNTVKTYTGTTHFTTSDAGAGVVVPADYTFLLTDNGQKIFTNGVTLQTLGLQTIAATDTGNATINASVPITVTSDAAITGTGRTIRIFRNNVPLVIASFTDGDAAEDGSHLTASIDWGDGQTSTGTVEPVGNSVFNVVGTHTYAKKGRFNVKVTLTDSLGSIAVAFSTAQFLPRGFSF